MDNKTNRMILTAVNGRCYIKICVISVRRCGLPPHYLQAGYRASYSLSLILLMSQKDSMYSCYRKICVISVISEPYIHLSLADFTDFAE